MNRNVAVPEDVSCAIASRWISVQCGASSSQKFTWPGATGALPARTVAVSVIAVPALTDAVGLPFVVTVRVVVVVAA